MRLIWLEACLFPVPHKFWLLTPKQEMEVKWPSVRRQIDWYTCWRNFRHLSLTIDCQCYQLICVICITSFNCSTLTRCTPRPRVRESLYQKTSSLVPQIVKDNKLSALVRHIPSADRFRPYHIWRNITLVQFWGIGWGGVWANIWSPGTVK